MASKGKGKETLQHRCCRCGGINKEPDELMECCKSAKNALTHWPLVKPIDASGVKDVKKRGSSDELEQRLADAARPSGAATTGGQAKKKGKGKPTSQSDTPSEDDRATANAIISAVQRRCDDNSHITAEAKPGDHPKLLEAPERHGVPLTKDICEAAFQICDGNAVKQAVDNNRAGRAPLETSLDASSDTPSEISAPSWNAAMGRTGMRPDVAESSKSGKKATDFQQPSSLIQGVCPVDGSHRNRMPIYSMPKQLRSSEDGKVAITEDIRADHHLAHGKLKAKRVAGLRHVETH